MTNIQTITMPNYDHLTENWAEVGMAAWITTNGGKGATYRLPDHDDYSTWVGDWQADDGTVYRLLVNEMTGEISAYELQVRFDFGEENIHGGEYIWSGKEWLQETRDEDAISADILAEMEDRIRYANLDVVIDDYDGELVTVIGEAI